VTPRPSGTGAVGGIVKAAQSAGGDFRRVAFLVAGPGLTGQPHALLLIAVERDKALTSRSRADRACRPAGHHCLLAGRCRSTDHRHRGDGDQPAGDALLDQFRQGDDVAGDHRQAGRQHFDGGPSSESSSVGSRPTWASVSVRSTSRFGACGTQVTPGVVCNRWIRRAGSSARRDGYTSRIDPPNESQTGLNALGAEAVEGVQDVRAALAKGVVADEDQVQWFVRRARRGPVCSPKCSGPATPPVNTCVLAAQTARSTSGTRRRNQRRAASLIGRMNRQRSSASRSNATRKCHGLVV